MKKAILTAAAFLLIQTIMPLQAKAIEPDGTYLYAVKDGNELYLDIYEPGKNSTTVMDGKKKPTVIFMFGGGFREGRRDSKSFFQWFEDMTDDGFRVVSIDYRLGMKDTDASGIRLLKEAGKAIRMAVEDLFSATSFLVDNAASLGMDPDNLVVSGSSAGAITSLQAEWLICNKAECTSILPEGFNYKGVMAFAGALFLDSGKAGYASEPCPTLFLHGTKDKIVFYDRVSLFNYSYTGSSHLAKIFRDKGWNYNIYRFKGRSHEIAGAFHECFPMEKIFLETNVMKGEMRIIDATVDDPAIDRPAWAYRKVTDLYSTKKE